MKKYNIIILVIANYDKLFYRQYIEFYWKKFIKILKFFYYLVKNQLIIILIKMIF